MTEKWNGGDYIVPNPQPSQEPFATPEFFADDANHLRIVNGVFRMTFYSMSAGADEMSMPVLHMAMPIQSLAVFVARAIQVMTSGTVPVPIAISPKTNDGHG